MFGSLNNKNVAKQHRYDVSDLLQLDDFAFCEVWRNMPPEQRAAIPQAERNECYARYRLLTPHVDKSIDRMRREDERKQAQQLPQNNERRLRLTPIGELLAQPEEQSQWLVNGLLLVGGLSVLSARPKVGKSTLMRSLAADVACGHNFLGRATVKGLVFILDLEGKRGETVSALRRLGITAADPIKVFCGSAPEGAFDDLRAAALKENPSLIIVDPLQRLARVRDLNDYATVSNAFDPFIALARDTGAHVLLLHHQGRGGRDGVDSPMGSTAIAGSVDTILTMKRRVCGTRTLATVQRYGSDMEETVVTIDVCGHAALGGLMLEHEQQEAEGRILAYLAEHPDAEQADIREGVEGRWAVVRAALTALVKDARVSRTGTGKKGDPFKYSGSASSLEPREPENQNLVPPRQSVDEVVF